MTLNKFQRFPDPDPTPSFSKVFTPGEPPTPPTEPTPPAEPVLPEGVNEDGTIQEGYTKLENGTVVKNEPPSDPPVDPEDEPEDDPGIDPIAFWKEVEDINQLNLQVDYGTEDPLSPKGAAIREKAAYEQGQLFFENFLKETDPKAFAYFLHRSNNGSDEDFFTGGTSSLIDKEAFKEDPDAQSALLFSDLKKKDIPEDVIQATINKYIKDGKLEEKATALYDKLLAEDRKRLTDIEASNKAREQQFQAKVQSVATSIEQGIKTNMAFEVPAQQQAGFNAFIMDKLQHDGNKFVFVLDQDDPAVLNTLYVHYLKGNIKSLVERTSRKETVQRLGKRVKADVQQSSGSAGSNSPNDFVSFGSV